MRHRWKLPSWLSSSEHVTPARAGRELPLARLKHRAAASLRRPRPVRGMTSVCAWCGDVVHREPGAIDVTHTICEPCFDRAFGASTAPPLTTGAAGPEGHTANADIAQLLPSRTRNR